MEDDFNLRRFANAQAPFIDKVLGELRSGRKSTHWMWFVFPQVEGLGSSSMSRRFAIGSTDEAACYLRDPLLGAHLVECTRLVLDVSGRTIEEIFGVPDYSKFQSCMTLFATVSASGGIFDEALQKYFQGTRDYATLTRLSVGSH